MTFSWLLSVAFSLQDKAHLLGWHKALPNWASASARAPLTHSSPCPCQPGATARIKSRSLASLQAKPYRCYRSLRACLPAPNLRITPPGSLPWFLNWMRWLSCGIHSMYFINFILPLVHFMFYYWSLCPLGAHQGQQACLPYACSRSSTGRDRAAKRNTGSQAMAGTCNTNREVCASFFFSGSLYFLVCVLYDFYTFLKISSFLRCVQSLLHSSNKRTHCLSKVKFLSPQMPLAPQDPHLKLHKFFRTE